MNSMVCFLDFSHILYFQPVFLYLFIYMVITKIYDVLNFLFLIFINIISYKHKIYIAYCIVITCGRLELVMLTHCDSWPLDSIFYIPSLMYFGFLFKNGQIIKA